MNNKLTTEARVSDWFSATRKRSLPTGAYTGSKAMLTAAPGVSLVLRRNSALGEPALNVFAVSVTGTLMRRLSGAM